MEILAGAARALAACCVLVTVLPFLPLRVWWIRAWEFPRQQIALLAVVAGAVLLLLGRWRDPLDAFLLAGLAAAIVWQAMQIAPYTPLWRKRGLAGPASAERGLRLVIVNVLMSNRQVDGLASSLRRIEPDLVLALEPDDWWTTRLAEILPEHAHRILHPLDTTYGIALFSRLPLVEPEIRFLLEPEIPSIRTRVRLRSGDEILLIGVHPEPPAPGEAATSLPRDAELVMVGHEIAAGTMPVIVGGDLNDVAWSHTSRLFRRLSGLIDPRIGRGFFNTFHAGIPWLRWPLDHVFYSDEFLLHDLRRLPAFGSDHFPIMIELAYTPRAAAVQDAPEATPADHRQSQEILAQARAALDMVAHGARPEWCGRPQPT